MSTAAAGRPNIVWIMADDPAARRDLFDERPDVVARLTAV